MPALWPDVSLDAVGDDIGHLMDRILKLFKPGAKITVVVRFPGYPEREVIMTDDDLDGVIETCHRRQAQPPRDY